MEVQRALEKAHDLSRRAKKKRGGKAAKKFELAFPAFQSRLFDLGLGWLSVEQQRVIFDTIDFDKSGTIEEGELLQIYEQRQRLEHEREETLAAEFALRAEAERK